MSLSVRDLRVVKAGKPILNGVTMAAPGGALTGLIGPNGAGKSTLLRALLGLEAATGSVTFEDHDLRSLPRRDRARLAAYVEQSSMTEDRVTVADVVGLGRMPFEAAWQSAPSEEDHAVIISALAETGMTGFATRRFSTLSGGEQQRVQVARALAQQPRLLLLDEPTSHLDIRAQLQLLALLQAKAKAGTTVVIAIHDLNLAARFCDHLVLMDHGTVVTEGAPATVLTPHLLLKIYGVRARLLPGSEPHRPSIVFDAAEPANPD
jgi:iron complex transport system ATP-binding protein